MSITRAIIILSLSFALAACATEQFKPNVNMKEFQEQGQQKQPTDNQALNSEIFTHADMGTSAADYLLGPGDLIIMDPEIWTVC